MTTYLRTFGLIIALHIFVVMVTLAVGMRIGFAGTGAAAESPALVDVNAVLFWIIVGDAIVILLFGIACAIAVLSGLKADRFWERAPPAMLILVGSSLGGAALLWGAGYLFGGAA